MTDPDAKVTRSRAFARDDQTAFAALSGDYNPLYMDPVLARRLIYGAPVVHGVHCLLWALDTWLEKQPRPVQLTALEAEFPKPLRVGEEAVLSISSPNAGTAKMHVTSGGATVAKIEARWQTAVEPVGEVSQAGENKKKQPAVLQADELEGRKGRVEVSFDRGGVARLFPRAANRLAPSQMGALLAATRLVGMECPGWHSIFFGLTLKAENNSEKRELEYEVSRFDERFQMALINVAGSGLAGEIRAFFRPAPQEQITCAGAKELVTANEFADQRAVIVGGSRGLGEVAAKLLAAGGAEVRITYHQGGTDAERIVQEIASAGGLAGCSQLDVLSASEPDTTAALREFSPNALYYFATPFIFAGSKSGFSDKLFQRFCGYYVSGFLNVLNSLKSTGVRKIFHPSSTAVEELPPDMMEYAAAKMAAETVCSTLEKNKQTRLIIYKPRLPRLNTDQTVSLVPAGNKEPAPILLEHLRTFRDRQRFPGGGSQSGQT